jgi:two-component system response regulator NreC
MKVLIVDDHAVLRAGVRTLLQSNPEIEVCGEASDGLDGLRKVLQLKPDLVILDIDMPVLDGLSAAREISKLSPEVAILLLSMHDSPDVIEVAKLSGASGYVAKNQAAFMLLRAVDTIAHNKTFFPNLRIG